MGNIFVAYGDPEHRQEVLAYAVRRAAVSGDELFVYHVRESPADEPDAIQDEVADVVARIDPDVAFTVHTQGPIEYADDANVSKQKRLTDAILQTDREFEYVVMGNLKRGTIEELTIPSMTKAVIETHAVPVLLVPVEGSDE